MEEGQEGLRARPSTLLLRDRGWLDGCGADACASDPPPAPQPPSSTGHSRARSSVLTRPLTAANCRRRATSCVGCLSGCGACVVNMHSGAVPRPHSPRMLASAACPCQDCAPSTAYTTPRAQLTTPSASASLMRRAVSWSRCFAAAAGLCTLAFDLLRLFFGPIESSSLHPSRGELSAI